MRLFLLGAAALAMSSAGQAATSEYQIDFQGIYFWTDNPDLFEFSNLRAIITVDDDPSQNRLGRMQHRIRGIRGQRNGLDIVEMDLEDHSYPYFTDPDWDWGDPIPPHTRGEQLLIANNPYLELRYGEKYWFGDYGFQFKTSDGIWYRLNSSFDFDGFNASEGQATVKPNDWLVNQRGLISLTKLDVSAAVPEPSSWGMMILGIGLAGGALRARRSRTSVRFA